MSHVFRSSLLLAFFFGFDKAFSLLRQMLVARQFGLSYEIDVFNAANNIPDLLSALISGGALGVALIPVLSEYLQKQGRPAAWDLFARILNLAFLVTAGLAAVIALFAPVLVREVIVPGFPAQQQALTIELMRLDLFAILIFSISGLLMAGLQANQHFLLPALAPVLYDAGQIFGAAVLAPDSAGPLGLPGMGFGIRGLVYGVILGALLHLLIQVPGLLRYGFRWAPAINLKHPGVQQVLRLMGPRLATMFFIQLFFITRDNLASRLGEGAVSALNYGWFIMQVPETLIGTAIAIVLLPTLAEFIARGELEAFQATVNRALRVLAALTIPIAALLAATLPALIGVLGFEPEDAVRVVAASRMYLLGLTGHALLEIAARSFYARQDARTPLWAAALNAALYLIFAIAFSGWWGYAGIALANSLAFTLEALLLLWLLNRRLPGLLRLGDTLVRTGAAAVLGALVSLAVLAIFQTDSAGTLTQIAVGTAALALGALAVLPLIWSRELKLLLKL